MKAVGDALGISHQAVWSLERGRTRAGIAMLLALAELFGVGVDALFEPVGPADSSTGGSSSRSEELLQAFASIGDPKQEKALLALSRAMAGAALKARRLSDYPAAVES